ncbi:hypothetical protein [Streptomyces sp. R41]|uniref:Sugar ABC transporter substrate-binding protein n=1 Tax=Streptomyces sp. R41 TaxID=3238632 RepID=A0AB39RW87_9ACTN
MTSAIARRTLLVGAAAAPLLAACAGDASDGVGGTGKVTIGLWHGQNDTDKKAVEALVARVQPDASA